MIIHTCEQRTDEWHALRLGRITATQFGTMANGRKDTIETLCHKIAAEKITGVSSDGTYTNEAMERGIELEDEAIKYYEVKQLVHVQRVGFISADDYFGVSPDGLVGDEGLPEIKCPQAHTHLKYLRKGGWRDYKWQCQGQLYVSRRKWLDFVSYHPDYPEHQRMLIERVLPDHECFAKIRAGMTFCRNRIDEILKEVQDD